MSSDTTARAMIKSVRTCSMGKVSYSLSRRPARLRIAGPPAVKPGVEPMGFYHVDDLLSAARRGCSRSLIHSASRALRRAALLTPEISGRLITTTSSPLKRRVFCLKLSLTMRLTRLRLTADGRCFLAIARARRGVGTARGRARMVT